MKQKPYAPLTEADRQIDFGELSRAVEAIDAGCTSTKELAKWLKMPLGTVRSRLDYVKAKFGVETLTELIKVVRD